MARTEAGVTVSGLTKEYDGGVVAVADVSLEIKRGEFVSLLGPSGCGKTTILRMIGGLIEPTRGEVEIHGQRVTHLPPWKRNCGFVFQSYALFPHMTVRDNIGYGLVLRKWPKDKIAKRVEEVAELLGIGDLLGRRIKALSGGQQQRVAVARALAIEPDVLLMDEPLANLDAKLRERIRVELRQIQRSTHVTTIYVTHDQAEALALSDRIVVMNKGKVEQVGSPVEVFARPATPFVASFVGNNRLVEGTVTETVGDEAVLHAGEADLRGKKIGDVRPQGKALAVLQAHNISVSPGSSHGAERRVNEIRGVLKEVLYMGTHFRAVVETSIGIIDAEVPLDAAAAIGLAAGSAVTVVVRDPLILGVS
ncbi:MAG: hypothetical protein BAA04_06495 [Firmicutes bacterium ZCTH02-B6]|nr:MAG: hypothetical protein BAA04_06495 [Firmicutes bacterium ZCTH02-B6]